LNDPIGTGALLDAIEEAAGAGKDGESASQPTQQILDLFSALKTRSLENKCSREKIERLLAFSPFDETPEIRDLIGSTKLSSDIDREVALTALPQRLREDEEEIKSLEALLLSLSTRVDASDLEARNLRKEIVALQSGVAQLNSDHKEIRATVETQAEAVRSATSLIASPGGDANVRFKELEERLALLTAGWEATAQSVTKIAADASTEEWIALFEGRIEVLEKKEAALPRRPSADTEATASRTDETGTTSLFAHARRLLVSAEEKIRPLASPADAANILATNLETLGLKRSASQTLAEEICAAAVVGQVVFLKGSLATEVARLCALTVGGRNSLRASMPIGLSDGEALGAAIQRELHDAGDGVPAVAIEGVNRSAIDVFEDAMSDLVIGDRGSLGSVRGPMFVFASVMEGSASLAINPRYLELGPIFDLDHLDWRLRRPTGAAFVAGTVSPEVLRSNREKLEATDVEGEEVLRLLRKFSPRKNPRVESVVIAALTALASMERRQKLPSPLQSIAYGWLVPFWVALGLSREDADSELDGGKCDTGAPDQRLKSILVGRDFRSERAERE